MILIDIFWAALSFSVICALVFTIAFTTRGRR